jgi:hypothetical protein
LNNLVEALESLVVEHALRGSEIFIFTDNSTAEAAFWKGTSKSEALFELVLRLKELELEQDIQLHVVHVSGKRMIAEGTDGLSRADHGEGVMLGSDIRTFIPLHLDPVVREAKVKAWIQDVTRGLDFFCSGRAAGVLSFEASKLYAFDSDSSVNDGSMATAFESRD